MPKISDPIDTGLMIQMIGKPGTGKSIAAASFPEPVYIFDLESRMLPVQMFFKGRDIEYDTFYIDEFEKFCRKLESFQLPNRFKTVIIDGLTPLADMLLQYGINLRGGEMVSEQNKGKFKRGVVDLNDIGDYNVETRGLIQVINILRELKSMNRILVTHLLESEAFSILTNKNTITQTTMTGGKKVAVKIPNYFNEVWNFYTRDSLISSDPPIYCMSALNRGFGLGKTCIPDLPKEIEFTRGGKNVTGSLYNVIEPFLKRSGMIV